ncbi:MAG: RNA pseudouridine synthase, partial [Paramuribaculum sp.]|nr:RNA pseudouridine synthase [Paramuribaculum sp.]
MHSTSPLDSIKNFRVESQEPVRLIDFLIISLPDTKRTRIKQMLAHRQVALRGVPVTQATALANPGDEVAVNFSREFREFRHRRLRIYYEDDDILV